MSVASGLSVADLLHVARTDARCLVVDDRVVRGKLVAPRGCDEIQTLLAPWLK
jgi:hypothetical protein